MTVSQIHAAILGGAIVLSSGIFVVRRSMAQREPDVNRVEQPEAPKTLPKDDQPASTGNRRTLDEAERLMKEAREILQVAQRMDNNEAQMLEVRKLVDQAQALLEPLPEDDPDVVATRRSLQVLHMDAVKVSNL